MNQQPDVVIAIQKSASEKTLPPVEELSRTENSFIDIRPAGKEKSDNQEINLEKGDKKSNSGELKIVKFAMILRFFVFFKVVLQIVCSVFYPVYCFALFADFVSYCGARNLVRKVLDFALVLIGVFLAVRSYLLYYFARILEGGRGEQRNQVVLIYLLGIIQCLETIQAALIIFIRVQVTGKNKVWVDRIANRSRSSFKYL